MARRFIKSCDINECVDGLWYLRHEPYRCLACKPGEDWLIAPTLSGVDVLEHIDDIEREKRILLIVFITIVSLIAYLTLRSSFKQPL